MRQQDILNMHTTYAGTWATQRRRFVLKTLRRLHSFLSECLHMLYRSRLWLGMLSQSAKACPLVGLRGPLWPEYK